MTSVALARIYRTAAVLVALALAACGGSDDSGSSTASRSDVRVTATTPGQTPFIASVELAGQSLSEIATVAFTIEPRQGAASKAVSVTYAAEALRRRGFVSGSGGAIKLPVFGLYAGAVNRVSIRLKFADASVQTLPLNIAAAPYADPNQIYDRVVIRDKRDAGEALGFDYFFMKSTFGTPVIVDTDGDIRWVGTGVADAFSSAFDNGSFIIGDRTAPAVRRLELDGAVTAFALQPAIYSAFHHNVDPGKQGLLAELDLVRNGVQNIESVVVEMSPTGVVLKEWDLAALLANYMTSQGDDPSGFVRPGIDWFHMNSATYDARDDTIIVSSRENFLVKIDYQTGGIVWIFGDPTKYWYTFPSLRAKAVQLAMGGLYPIGQHATSITSDGHLMLFNDGGNSINQPMGQPAGEARTYSAVSAYDIDPAARTAREVWRFDYGQTIFSDICSSAYQASNKSVLISYAAAEGRTKARLVGLDANRNVVFDFEYASPPCSTSWNAQPISLDDMTFN